MKNDFLWLPSHPTMQLAYNQTRVCPLFKSLGVTVKQVSLISVPRIPSSRGAIQLSVCFYLSQSREYLPFFCVSEHLNSFSCVENAPPPYHERSPACQKFPSNMPTATAQA